MMSEGEAVVVVECVVVVVRPTPICGVRVEGVGGCLQAFTKNYGLQQKGPRSKDITRGRTKNTAYQCLTARSNFVQNELLEIENGWG